MVTSDQEFDVNFRFRVKAVSQEQANLKVESTMAKFAEFMGWAQPDKLMKVRK
jgi:hypothetical protein